MTRCALNKTLTRVQIEGFSFPLGVYPVEPVEPGPGYTLEFEPADGDDEEGDWEEWPDRYVFDVVITSERMPTLCRMMAGLLPGRVYPILDILGHDAYREVDPYIAYEPVGLDRFLDGLIAFGPYLLEDGTCGFGAMSEDPFFYFFLDEHKILTIRAEPTTKERVDKVLAAFDLREIPELKGADSVTHEHRGVLWAPDHRPELLSAEEIVEQLRDDWRLTLNLDAASNLDDEGRELGLTGWRAVLRCLQEPDGRVRYAEVYLLAWNLDQAEELGAKAAGRLLGRAGSRGVLESVVLADRLLPEELASATGRARLATKYPEAPDGRIILARWLE